MGIHRQYMSFPKTSLIPPSALSLVGHSRDISLFADCLFDWPKLLVEVEWHKCHKISVVPIAFDRSNLLITVDWCTYRNAYLFGVDHFD